MLLIDEAQDLVAGGAGADPPHLQPRDGHREAHPDRAHGPVRAAGDARPPRAAPARPARHRALSPLAARAARRPRTTSATGWWWRAAKARSPSPPPRSPPCTSKSGGIPRLVNLICDRALLAGYVAGPRVIDAPHGPAARRARRAAAPARGRHGCSSSSARRRSWSLARVGRGAGADGWPARRPRPARRPPAPRAAATVPPLRRRRRRPARSRPWWPPCPATRPTTPRSAQVQRAVGRRRARAHGAAHAHGPGAPPRPAGGARDVPSRRAPTPATSRCCASRAMTPSCPPAPGRRCACRWPRWTGCGRARPCSSGGTSTPCPAEAIPARTEAWARDNLSRMGYLRGDPDLAGAVARFQRDAELAADGVHRRAARS